MFVQINEIHINADFFFFYPFSFFSLHLLWAAWNISFFLAGLLLRVKTIWYVINCCCCFCFLLHKNLTQNNVVKKIYLPAIHTL